MSRVIEPRKQVIVGADVVSIAPAAPNSHYGKREQGPTGVEEQGAPIMGSLRNLGEPVISVEAESGSGSRMKMS